MPATFEPIASVTLSAATASVTLSNIPQTFTDLVIITADIVNSTNLANLYLQFNGNTTGSFYSDTYIESSGSTGASSRRSNQNSLIAGRSYGGDRTMNIINIMNYSNTTTNKTVISRYGSGGASSSTGAEVGLWRKTEAITSILIGIEGGINFNSNCSFSLYGIRAGS
jgi:hypothetical protein